MREPYFSSADIARPGTLGGGNWSIQNLNSITVIFGKNSSGKSLLLRSWRNSNPGDIHYVVPERIGALTFEPTYLQQELRGEERRQYSDRNYLGEYRQRVVTRIQTYFTARGNARANTLPGDPTDLERLISQLIPDFTISLDGLSNPPYQLKRMPNDTAVENIDQLSSGEAQLLTLGLDILTIGAIWDIENREQRLILLDEPDAHIHPDLQVRFADFIVQVAEKYSLQIVVATHSTTFMAALGQFGDSAASVLYLDRTKSDFTANVFSAIAKELAACLGGHALMGPLFSVPILLVEGDDDYRIWSQVPRHHVVSFSVIPSNGEEIKRYQKSLEQMLNALREEGADLSGYALLDGDKGKPEPTEQAPQNHIKYIKLSCHEAENLYLTDEVLASMGIDWETAQTRIVDNADRYGNKAESLRSAPNWDRSAVDIKNLMVELNAILDEKNVHWTIRVAQTIGRERPSGQLSEFLGDEVLGSLWGPVEEPQ
ncbi:MAG: AAA family ATPase [Gammaproteobacteria bacterium]|nr:AAA family ATPase [Gammaproteobacteria bacterium]